MPRSLTSPLNLFGRGLGDNRAGVAELIQWGIAVVLVAALMYCLVSNQLALLLTIVITTALLIVGTSQPATAALWTLVYLMMIGEIRRAVTYVAGPVQPDPLLLVAPVVASVLAAPILIRLRVDDTLSKVICVLMLVMVLQIANPTQGGIAVGVTGAMFYLVPIFWFWIGRHYASPSVMTTLLYRVLLPMAIVSSVAGLLQTFYGFTPYQELWIKTVSKEYQALSLGKSIRAFGFSTSAAEYAIAIMMATVTALAAFYGGRRGWVAAVPLLFTAIVLASGRTIVFKLVVAAAVIFAIRHRTVIGWPQVAKSLAYAGLAMTCVVLASSRLMDAGLSDGSGRAVREAVGHQLGGLARPLDSRHSTATLHGAMLVSAVVQGLTFPLGRGLGATSLASARFGDGSATNSSEVDFGDAFISLGLVGGVVYVTTIVLVLLRATDYVNHAPRVVGLPVAAILVSTVGTWLIAGQYATSATIFFIIGALTFRESSARCLPS